VSGFVVQFGLSPSPAVNAVWKTAEFPDDPVKQTNAEGTITFATRGPNTRTTQLFINLGQNARLDAMGFSPFGKVIEGMDVVEKLFAIYGERPDQERIQAESPTSMRTSRCSIASRWPGLRVLRHRLQRRLLRLQPRRLQLPRNSRGSSHGKHLLQIVEYLQRETGIEPATAIQILILLGVMTPGAIQDPGPKSVRQ
jgi:cyclophilin family peptidyl-prolyl cis-trans isomerase